LLANLFLETFFATFSWKPVPGNLDWEPVPGNLAWHLPWNLAWGPVLGNLGWESFLATLLANLFLGNMLGNLVLWVAEDPKLTLLGKNVPKQVPRKRLPSRYPGRGFQARLNS